MSTIKSEVPVLEAQLTAARESARLATIAVRRVDAQKRVNQSEGAIAMLGRKIKSTGTGLPSIMRAEIKEHELKLAFAQHDLAEAEKELSAQPAWKKIQAELSALFREFLAASAAAPDSFHGYAELRVQLKEIAKRESDAIVAYNNETIENGLPRLTAKLGAFVFQLVLPEFIVRDISQFVTASDKARAELQKIAANF